MPFRVCLKTPKYCLFAQKWCFRRQKSSKGGSISCGFFLESTHFWPNIQHFSGFQTDSSRKHESGRAAGWCQWYSKVINRRDTGCWLTAMTCIPLLFERMRPSGGNPSLPGPYQEENRKNIGRALDSAVGEAYIIPLILWKGWFCMADLIKIRRLTE